MKQIRMTAKQLYVFDAVWVCVMRKSAVTIQNLKKLRNEPTASGSQAFGALKKDTRIPARVLGKATKARTTADQVLPKMKRFTPLE